MSRVAKAPVALPNGTSVTLNGQQVEVKGSKGTLTLRLHDLVELKQEDNQIILSPINPARFSNKINNCCAERNQIIFLLSTFPESTE